MGPAANNRRLTQVAEIGRLVAAGRKQARISQAEFAAKLGVSRKTISDFERGAAAHVSLNTALKALWLAGLQLEASPRRPPTIREVMARRAADLARTARLGSDATKAAPSTKR